MWQIWIDTGGTFTDGLARDAEGTLHRTKVLSSGRLRGQLQAGRLVAPWLTAPIFDGYTLRVVATNETYLIQSLQTDGTLSLAEPANVPNRLMNSPEPVTVELLADEEAPVLAARLLTQTPLNHSFPPLTMRLGTTRGTNALLERRGARVLLLVTAGFRDLLVIGNQQRPDLFQLAIPPAEVLYDSVLDVPERITAGGDVLLPLTDAVVADLVQQVSNQQPEAVAISLLNAYANPVHEQQLADALRRAGFSVVVPSTQVSTAPGYVARTQTAVVDAYLTPVLATYLTNVQTQLGSQPDQDDNGSEEPVRYPPESKHPVRVMTSAGGLVRADLFQPKDSLLSGPAGGVIGASAVVPHEAVLTLDMGGTSTDVARLEHGQPDYRFSTPIGPFELQLPSLAIETVAAGGGSICWFDALTGQLRVGPQSAGAHPGPACYGVGGPLTITDVNLLLGKLDPQQFGIPIFRRQATEALADVAEQVHRATGQPVDTDDLLRGFERIANELMAGAIRTISVARGFDPGNYSLLVFGGAGGLHGCAVARLLGICRLLLPFDGGLLSAYGIGQARIERRANRSVLQTLATVAEQIPHWVGELTRQATAELLRDVAPDEPAVSTSATLLLRLQGQEATVPIPVTENGAAAWTDAFREQYRRLYGYLQTDRPIDVESLRVVVQTVWPNELPAVPPAEPKEVAPTFRADQYLAYDWTTLHPGDSFTGPALLLNTTSSAFIEPGWAVTIQPDNAAVAHLIAQEAANGGTGVSTSQGAEEANEVVQLELFTQRFRAIADEMGAQLQRTAFSVNVKERLDFSCALLDANARLVVNAPHIPVHLGSLGVCARLMLERMQQAGTPPGPGDVLITNHPKYGGSHLPDVTLLQGVFMDDEQPPRLIGYVINRAHHAEIGGRTPGSMPPDAHSLVEEGVVLEPQFLVRRGVFLWETGLDGQPETGLAHQFTHAPFPTRALTENRADLEAAVASLRSGEAAGRKLVQTSGLETVHRYMDHLQQSAQMAMQRLLSRQEGQTFAATETLDDGYQIQVRLTVANQQLTVDWRGTGPVHPNNLNANLSILHSAVLYVLRLWVGQQVDATYLPLNEGLMAPVQFMLPEQSLVNPHFPDDPAACPAVVGGNTEVSQRLVDTLLKALGLAACSQGTMNNFLFGNDRLGYYETIGGGVGATLGQAGRSGIHQHMTNTRLTDPETLERRYPVRLWQFGLRTGSGGAGAWRGGEGLVRELEFLAPLQATLVSQHRVVAPYGLAGGEPGLPGRQTLVYPAGQEISLPGLFTRQMQPGERLRIETPGGGGAGAAR